jgi:hypothetical protein
VPNKQKTHAKDLYGALNEKHHRRDMKAIVPKIKTAIRAILRLIRRSELLKSFPFSKDVLLMRSRHSFYRALGVNVRLPTPAKF